MISAQEQLENILNKISKALNNRGINTLRTLGKAFRSLDSFDGQRKVDRDEFYIGLKENGVQLSKSEADLLLAFLDKNRDGTIDFREFLTYLRGSPNEYRQSIIDSAFSKYDTDASGYLLADDIRKFYNCSCHPKVKRAEITQEQAFQEFLQNFVHGTNGKITRDEWNDYYASVSAQVQADEHFAQLMQEAWQL